MIIEGTAAGSQCHLSYCTNIHPGEGWSQVKDSLETYCTAVKQRLAPSQMFGVGLRLSALAAAQLSAPGVCGEFCAWLKAAGLYIFTINGFPFGAFHGERVKERVYLPDWRHDARLQYTNQLADLMSQLAPEKVSGSISTVPGAFRPAITSTADARTMAANLARHVAHLVQIERRSGKTVRTALEPEPCCHIETLAEARQFFEQHMLAAETLAVLADQCRFGTTAAELAVRRHLGVCIDLCHLAVEFEDLKDAVAGLRSAGIMIPKVQISAGLRVPQVTAEAVQRLRALEDHVYLHQVVERSEGQLQRFLDLDEACDSFRPDGSPREWRVHFHVPIFLEEMAELATTRATTDEALALHREAPLSDHFEVETYTFGVLPAPYREADLVTHLTRELQWAAQRLRH